MQCDFRGQAARRRLIQSFMHATVHSRTRQARPSLVRPHNVFGLIYQQGRSAPLALLIHREVQYVCLYLNQSKLLATAV